MHVTTNGSYSRSKWMQVTSNESYHSSNAMCNPFPKRMTQQNNNWESSGSGAWQPLSLTVEMATSFQRCGTLTLNPIKALSMRSLFSFEELDFLAHHWVKLTTPSALDFCSIQGNQLWPRIPSSLPPSMPPPKKDWSNPTTAEEMMMMMMMMMLRKEENQDPH
jgi:hypothetical protein